VLVVVLDNEENLKDDGLRTGTMHAATFKCSTVAFMRLAFTVTVVKMYFQPQLLVLFLVSRITSSLPSISVLHKDHVPGIRPSPRRSPELKWGDFPDNAERLLIPKNQFSSSTNLVSTPQGPPAMKLNPLHSV
jgi:hypothetical protein